MSKELKVILGVVVLGIVALVFLFSSPSKPVARLGSVDHGGEYQSTTTSAAGYAGLQVTIISTSTIAANGSGVLGSVVVSSTTPATPTTATCRLQNATSSTDVSSTTLASFPVQTTAGTYTYDTNVTRGLIAECGAGFSGAFTITYRP